MLFTTSQFFVFFTGIFVAYWAGPEKLPRNLLLLLASWFFYSAGEVRFFPVLLLFTSLDFICAKFIDQAHQDNRSKDAFALVTVSVTANIGLLAFFKLSWLFISWWPALKNVYILQADNVLLPIGVSFYTFQSLSYAIDVYRRKIPVCKSFVDFALYVSFFPQLIAGPIERGGTLLPQLQAHYLSRVPTVEMRQRAAWLIFWGILKKIAIANRLMPYARWGVSELNLTHGMDVWLASTAFILEFLCDFSAYSDIAMGLALLFGIHLSENFRYPYFSTSPSEFWRRWHITLGAWFKDYLYLPLHSAGAPQWVILILTMTLVGVWHGAEPKFILWGLMWGFLILGERLLRPFFPKAPPRIIAKAMSFGGWAFLMLSWICLGFLFVAPNIPDAWTLMNRALVLTRSDRFESDLCSVLFFLSPFFLIEFLQWRTQDRFFWFSWPLWGRLALVTVLTLFLIANHSGENSEFIYFAF